MDDETEFDEPKEFELPRSLKEYLRSHRFITCLTVVPDGGERRSTTDVERLLEKYEGYRRFQHSSETKGDPRRIAGVTDVRVQKQANGYLAWIGGWEQARISFWMPESQAFGGLTRGKAVAALKAWALEHRNVTFERTRTVRAE
jgi:hypothetical protein